MNNTEDMERKAFLKLLVNMGVLLLGNGSEISRVEDTLSRIGTAYGAEHMNVFVITSGIIVTMIFPDKREYTVSRRITAPASNHFRRLERLNELSRRYCKEPFDMDRFENELEEIAQIKQKKYISHIGSIIAAGTFALFFGGNLLDGFSAACIGLLLSVSSEFLGKIAPNQLIFQLISSFLSGMLIQALHRIFPILNPEMIMIGDIMLLVPGIALTYSIRDILVGNTISGLLKITETCMWAGALAAGFMLSMAIL